MGHIEKVFADSEALADQLHSLTRLPLFDDLDDFVGNRGDALGHGGRPPIGCKRGSHAGAMSEIAGKKKRHLGFPKRLPKWWAV